MMAMPQISFYPQCFADYSTSYNQNWFKENMPSNIASRPQYYHSFVFPSNKTSSQAPSYASPSPNLLPTHLLADGGEVKSY